MNQQLSKYLKIFPLWLFLSPIFLLPIKGLTNFSRILRTSLDRVKLGVSRFSMLLCSNPWPQNFIIEYGAFKKFQIHLKSQKFVLLEICKGKFDIRVDLTKIKKKKKTFYESQW